MVPFLGILCLDNGHRGRTLAASHYPLIAGRVKCHLVDVNLSVTIQQTYVSTVSEEREIAYIFPLPPEASVYSFRATFGDNRTIEGIVKEKNHAKAEYEQAISKGQSAALLEWQNQEVFQTLLGKIQPKETVQIELSYVSVVPNDGDPHSLRVMFPSTLVPRYGIPPEDILPAAYQITTMEFSVGIQMASPVQSITSPSHSLSVTLGSAAATAPSGNYDPTMAYVLLSEGDLQPNQTDIVLIISSNGLDRPRCTVEKWILSEDDDSTEAYSLTLVPRFNLPNLPQQEYIFLVDRSGSMYGAAMEGVKKALQIMLKSLPSEGTTFNIISFGYSTSSIFPKSVPYTSDNVRLAYDRVTYMDADMGGTEIAKALACAFESSTSSAIQKTPTAIFLLTDGDAWDLTGVLRLVKSEMLKAQSQGRLLRIFTLGIGDGVSRAMCDGISKEGRGSTVYVADGESPNVKLVGLLKATRAAFVQNIKVDWGVEDDEEVTNDFEVVQSETISSLPEQSPAPPIQLYDETSNEDGTALGPQDKPVVLGPIPRIQQTKISALYSGVRTHVFAIIRVSAISKFKSAHTVKITGTALDQLLSLEIPVIQAAKTEAKSYSGIVHRLAARYLIEGFQNRSLESSDVDKAEIIRLALRYNLASSQTSFLAVDPTIRTTTQLAHDISCEVPKEAEYEESDDDMGFGLFDDGPAPTPALASVRSAAPCLVSKFSGVQASLPEDEGSDDDMGFSLWDDGPAAPPVAPQPVPFATPRVTEVDPLARITEIQEFDGSFSESAFLFKSNGQDGGKSSPLLPSMLSASIIPGKESIKAIIWNTALCLSWLEVKAKDAEPVWSMMSEKGMEYIRNSLVKDLGIPKSSADDFLQRLVSEAKSLRHTFVDN